MSRPPADPADSSPNQDPGRRPNAGLPGQGRPDNDGPAAARDRPGAVTTIAAIVAAEATALLGVAVWYGYNLLTGSPVLSFWGAVFTLALLLAFSAWLFAVATFHFRGYRWTRAAALVAQLFVLTIGFPTLSGGLIAAGAAMVVPAVLALVLLFHSRVISYASRTGGGTPAL
ncbi:hypothetical protein ACIQCM_03840 [Pseudarthrobacter sp. NPDC092439]|uniref:hypothetical protein n=1 Tax=unclassified Pseudarthrobacter TaxID=2647000 RepID=UPI00381B511F